MQDRSDHLQIRSLPEVIYERLRGEIARGELQPGPLRLRPLAERFGTSPIPVREALRRLEADRLVTFMSNRAITVNAVSAGELDEIFAIRKELEPLALRRGMQRLRGDADGLSELAELIDRMDAQESDPQEWRTTNEVFHMRLYAAADSPRLLSAIENLWVAVEPYLRMYVTSVPSLRQAQEQHKALVAAVRAGDGAGAEAILREHLEATRSVVHDLMSG